MKDYIIVGLGLAGISFTHLLEKHSKSFFVYNAGENSATLTSGAFFNPVVLKRFTPIWKAQEQMTLLRPFYEEIQQKIHSVFVEKLPTYRKFASTEEQNDWFFASEKPILQDFLSKDIKKEVSPLVSTPFGLGEVLYTGRLHTKDLVAAYQKHLKSQNLLFEERFDYEKLEIHSDYISYNDIKAKRIVFCEGFGLKNNPFFNYLPLVGCKGELLSFKAEGLSLDSVIKGDGFIFPDQDHFKIGATYHFEDKSPEPTQEAAEELLTKLKKFLLCDFTPLAQHTAIRPTTKDRRPLVGKHPHYHNLYVLNGLGTRGSMLAPYTATALFNHIEYKQEIEKEMNISRIKTPQDKGNRG